MGKLYGRNFNKPPGEVANTQTNTALRRLWRIPFMTLVRAPFAEMTPALHSTWLAWAINPVLWSCWSVGRQILGSLTQ